MRSPVETRGLTEAKLRRWLSLLAQPHRLAELPELEALLETHGRLPDTTSALAIGHAAAEFLTEVIQGLEPPEEAAAEERLPYLVLKTCFLDGAKLWQAANELGMSERKVTNERSRAIQLLLTELDSTTPDVGPRYRPEPIPAILGFLERPAISRALREALEQHHFVRVHGPAGAGKTSLVAELAAEGSERHPTLWYRFRTGVNDSAEALLFELGEHLRARRRPELSRYLAEALPSPDQRFAARLALKGLVGSLHLLVLDDYHLVDEDQAIEGFLEEAAARLPDLRVITVGRHRDTPGGTGTWIQIPSFSRIETNALLGQLSIDATPQMANTIHSWTEGIPHLVKLAAAWLKTATDDEIAHGTDTFNDREEVQAFLLDSITELMGPEDRIILNAASVFRDRFTDEALAFVAERTRGEVQDTSSRLVRAYVATRSRGGDVAFFHGSVRAYVYARLDRAARVALHERAAEWYRRKGEAEGARYHRQLAEEAKDHERQAMGSRSARRRTPSR